MKEFNIKPIHDPQFELEVIDKIDNLTKPKGSLGRLEELAKQICMIQHTLSPRLSNPYNILFASDHGIVEEGVSVSPKEITWQQLYNFLDGGAGISFLCRQHGFELMLVDAGVDYDLPYDRGIINMKVRKSTRNYLREAAMTKEEMELCIERGAECVEMAHNKGCNIVSFGEMGIANTSASSLWMSSFANIPLKQCIGAGAGLQAKGIEHKYQVLKQAQDNFKGEHTAEEIICRFYSC